MTIQEQQEVSVSRACSRLDVSRSGYRKWLRREQPQLDLQEMNLRVEIQDIATAYTCYGYRRMTAELQRREIRVNHKRVLRLMREDNLLCVKRVFRPQTTDSNHCLRVFPNSARELEVSTVNRLWVADLTYVRLVREFVYLAVILDAFSRRCIGWELSRNIDTQLTLNALEKALETRKGTNLTGLIRHSDQGVQYASKDYISRLIEYGIQLV